MVVKSVVFSFLGALTLFLSACGSTSEESSATDGNSTVEEIVISQPDANETTETITGLFIDSVVANLHYYCNNQSSLGNETFYGVTNAEGVFSCDVKSTIHFYLADDSNRTVLELGYAEVASLLSPLDLEGSMESSAEVLHLLQLLQTLDIDNNATNGIFLDLQKSRLLTNAGTLLKSSDFEKTLETLLGSSVVSAQSALEHFNETLSSYNLETFTVDTTPPLFTTPNIVTPFENEAFVLKVEASDNNESLAYSIYGGSELFTLDASTGELRFVSSGDYEQQSRYELLLKAYDGVNTAYQTLTIELQDVDENVPVFHLPSQIYVDENQTFAFDINVTDESPLSFSISGEDAAYFEVNQSSAVVSFTTLSDYESTLHAPAYNINITADDGRNPTVTASVELILNPINDNAPLIFADDFTTYENEQVVMSFSATDADKDPLSVTLSGEDASYFQVENFGLSFVNIPDFETQKNSYVVTLEVNDTLHTTAKTILITLLDVDENAPVFVSASSVTMDENLSEVIRVEATDESSVTYSLGGVDSNYFELNASSGVLRFKVAADYEEKVSYSLSISAIDARNNSSTQNLSITLNNMNDNAPTIESTTTSFSLLENSTFIGKILIHDEDGDPLSVRLDNATLFEYNSSTEELSFVVPPDYESDAHSYTLGFTLDDTKYTTSQTFTIELLDEVDTPATLGSTTLSVEENVAIGTVVGSAVILDGGDSNITAFTLMGTGAEAFSIDAAGTITTAGAIDYEKQQTYALSVKAENGAGESQSVSCDIHVKDVVEHDIPLLVIVMNWNNYAQNDPSIWYDKFFNTAELSVAKWYQDVTLLGVNPVPVAESSNVVNDGIIMVDMGVNHPGGNSDTDFRDTYLTNAITSAEVVDNVDFQALDLDGNGDIDASELQIVFIVSGGEMSFGDAADHSIWAHSWSYGSTSAPTVDGVSVMRYNGDEKTSGNYARFGASHGDHLATIGIIVHELGHSMLHLRDFYDDDSAGSGLGWYDVMSGGSWAYQESDTYAGATPTQLTVYNKLNAEINVTTTTVTSTSTVTIACGKNEQIKLPTTQSDEYFLLECRDTKLSSSDISMSKAYNGGFAPNDNASFSNRLFSVMYHVDDTKSNNHESGTQTSANHYNIALVEKDTTNLMPSTGNIQADYNDVYIEGDIIDSSKTVLFDGSQSGYSVEIINDDYTNRTVTFKITK